MPCRVYRYQHKDRAKSHWRSGVKTIPGEGRMKKDTS